LCTLRACAVLSCRSSALLAPNRTSYLRTGVVMMYLHRISRLYKPIMVKVGVSFGLDYPRAPLMPAPKLAAESDKGAGKSSPSEFKCLRQVLRGSSRRGLSRTLSDGNVGVQRQTGAKTWRSVPREQAHDPRCTHMAPLYQESRRRA